MKLGEVYEIQNGIESAEYVVTMVSCMGYKLQRKDYPKTKISAVRLPTIIWIAFKSKPKKNSK